MITQWIVVHGPRLVWHIFVPPRDIVSIYMLLKSKPSFLERFLLALVIVFRGIYIITTKTTIVAKQTLAIVTYFKTY